MALKKEQVYLVVIGVLAVLLVATASVALLNLPSAKPSVAPSVNVSTAPSAPSAAEGTTSTATVATGDEAWFGIQTVLVTPKKVVVEGVAKVPDVSLVEASVESKDQEQMSVPPDPRTGRWYVDFAVNPDSGDSMKIDFMATVGGRTVSVSRTVDLSDSGLATPPSGADALQADWLAAPVSVTSTDIAAALGVPVAQVDPADANLRSTFWKVGTVRGGEYDGDEILVVEVPCQGPCMTPNLARMVLDRGGKRLVNLSIYGMDKGGLFADETAPEVQASEYFAPGPLVADDPALLLSEPGLPKSPKLAGSDYGLSWNEEEAFFTDPKDVSAIGKTADRQTIYSGAGGCLYLRGADLVYRAYDLVLPFQGKATEVTFTDGGQGVTNYEDYGHQDVGGCGAANCWAVRAEKGLGIGTELVAVGKTSNGETVYGHTTDAADRKDALSAWPEGMTGSDYTSGRDAAGRHLVFYWKDPFGRWIRFVKVTALPPVECGKPVIYLYPESEEPVHVSLGLKGTLSASEPAYGGAGWSVLARPDGYVTNLEDGKTYPNLYWEGTGVGYEIPKGGFVIPTASADSWLEATLARIGFTARESAEFREFWVPRMPKTPYVFITFVDQKYFDRDAPLRISPAPDAVYRVFMESRGLDAPASVPPIALPKIVRKGFTVVEWGGALR